MSAIHISMQVLMGLQNSMTSSQVIMP